MQINSLTLHLNFRIYY